MAPWTTILRGPVELAAADSWGRLLTVVVGPPAPPMVLHVTINVRSTETVVFGCSPAVRHRIANVGNICDAGPLLERLCRFLVDSRSWRCSDDRSREYEESGRELHDV
jgi:hypothetical protein